MRFFQMQFFPHSQILSKDVTCSRIARILNCRVIIANSDLGHAEKMIKSLHARASVRDPSTINQTCMPVIYFTSKLSDSHTSGMIRLQSTSFVGFQRVGKKHAEQIVVANMAIEMSITIEADRSRGIKCKGSSVQW